MSQTVKIFLTRFASKLGDDLENVKRIFKEDADVEKLGDASKRI